MLAAAFAVTSMPEGRGRSKKWKPGHVCFLKLSPSLPFKVVRRSTQRGGCDVQAFDGDTSQQRFVKFDEMLPFECNLVRMWRKHAESDLFRSAVKAALEQGVTKLEGGASRTAESIWDFLFSDDEVRGCYPNGVPPRPPYPF